MVYRFILYSIIAGIISCKTVREEDISYMVYRQPIEGFEKMKFIGITGNKNLHPVLLTRLNKQIDKCQQFKKSTILKNRYKIEIGDEFSVHKSIRNQVKKNRDDRYAHGILYVEFKNIKKKQKNTKISLIKAKYNDPYYWHDTFATTADISDESYAFEEISRKPTYSTKDRNYQIHDSETKVRYVLYNAKTDRLVFDKTSNLKTVIATYSSKPPLDANKMAATVFQQLLSKIVRNTCTQIAQVERKLISINKENKVDKLITSGVNMALTGDWEGAGNSWQNAILLNQDHALAHHNLGIYYERSGKLPKAIEEFERARNGTHSEILPPGRFERSLDQIKPKWGVIESYPKILSITSTNGITVVGGFSGQLEPGKKYSLYRSTKITHRKNHHPKGLRLIEVGKVQIEKTEPGPIPQYLGRVIEFTGGFHPQTGDSILDE